MTINRLKYGIAVLTLIASALTGGQASAGVLTNTLSNGRNTYEDKSRDIVVDVDGSKTLSAGDILYGFARLDNKATDPNSGPLDTDTVYVAFSQTVVTIPASPFVAFAPTVGAFSLSTLTGDAIDPGAFFAVYQDAGGFGDLLNNALGAANITTIAGGDLILTAGLGKPDDYFQAFPIFSSLTLSNAFIGTTVAVFSAGLTVLQQPGLPSVTFNENIAGSPFVGGLPTDRHQLVIGSGAAQWAGPLDVTLNPSGYTYFDTLKVTVDVALVPEPMSMAVWGGLVGLGYIGAFRRRRA